MVESEVAETVTPSIEPTSVTQGEDHQKKGHEGEQDIIRWLQMTTRIVQFYRRDTELAKTLLVYKWPYSKYNFSFDFGGQFRGGEIEGQSFLAESKAYDTSNNLEKEFRKFLAQAYALAVYHPNPPSHFLWISFSPHGTDKWKSLASSAEVRAAIIHKDNRARLFGTEDLEKVTIDEDAVQKTAESIWVLIYSKRFQTISMETEHYKLIQAHIAGEAVAL